MAPQPAQTCCMSCSLLQGAQVIASYTVVIGFFSVLSLLMGPAETESQPMSLTIVDFMVKVVHFIALIAGLKGLVGVVLRDPVRLRVLLTYHVLELFTSVIRLIVQEAKGCEQLERLEELSKTKTKLDCASFQYAMLIQFVIHASLISYFAYIIWSLITRLENGDITSALGLGETELGDRSALGLGDPWLFVHPSSMGTDPNALLQQRAPLRGNSGQGAPQPFSGAPRNLGEQQAGTQAQPAAPAPFQGTPHRLE
eukprot:TRINITY_DN97432_c0_g1_i1.p1 TRINITY_DN97432_c0_g1~~TRINITY_DN97432_c0_g1_i1.p1  ORF type:complete len:255 (-),score=42.23 TRINITY_DN97432_c0_g1_i1:218-982(-)